MAKIANQGSKKNRNSTKKSTTKVTENANQVEDTNVSETEETKVENQTTQVNETSNVDNATLQSILDRLSAVEAENKQLKEKDENMFVKARKRYEGPRAYHYAMWAGVPVLSYKSSRRDPSKDFSYKGMNGEVLSNHDLELTLANNTKVTVDVNDFNNHKTISEKLQCEVRSDGYNVTGYVFNTEDFWTFTVLPMMING